MTININDKNIKFGFGLYFLGKAQKENNTDLFGLLQSIVRNPVSDMVDLMYFSAKCEAELDEVELLITKRELLDFLEENNDFKNVDGYLSKWSKKLLGTIEGNFIPKEDEEDTDDKTVSKKK